MSTTKPIEAESAPEGSKPRDLKVLILTPCLGDLKCGMGWSVARAMHHFSKIPYDGFHDVDWEIEKGSNLCENRARLASRALKRGATHVLWWDSDIKAPADCIARMLNRNKPFVAANYPTKEVKSRPTAYADEDEYTGPVWTLDAKEGLQRVSHVGLGLVLMESWLFESLSMPWFIMEAIEPDRIKIRTEDYYFCDKLRNEAGVELFVDHDVSKQIAHIGEFEYTNYIANMAQETHLQFHKNTPDLWGKVSDADEVALAAKVAAQ